MSQAAAPTQLGPKSQFAERERLEEFSSFQQDLYLDDEGWLQRADGALRDGRVIILGVKDGQNETLWLIPDLAAAERLRPSMKDKLLWWYWLRSQ